MADTNFTDYVTPVPAEWLNYINDYAYNSGSQAYSVASLTSAGKVSGATATGTGTSSAVVGVASGAGWGVYGNSASSGNGVYGNNSSTGNGVYGYNTSSGAGVRGANVSSGYGVWGWGLTGVGVYGQSSSAAGVHGVSVNSHGVIAESDTTSPAKSAFRIVPQNSEPTGANAVGDIYVTTAGVLKICTVAGTPGTWVSVGAQV